jgi:putative FmdB family regulatory protein
LKEGKYSPSPRPSPLKGEGAYKVDILAGRGRLRKVICHMPIFEFRCEKCKKTFETIVFGSQEVSCPKCKSKKVKKLMSACSHSSEGKFSSSQGSGCGSCSATSCGPS